MANIKEKAAVDHFKGNYNLSIDYIVCLNHDLKGETIKPLKDIRLGEKSTLETILGALETRIHLLEVENGVLKDEIKETNTKLDELKLVFERTIKELITR